MPLLNLGNRRSAQAGNAGEVGKLDYRIGNPHVGQGVYLTGSERVIEVSSATAPQAYQDHESIAVSSTALPLTAAKADNYATAFITVETDAVRFWLDGTAPSATVGHKLEVGDTLVLDGRAELDGVRFIRVTTDAALRVSYANRVV